MLGNEQFEMINKISSMSEEDRLTIIYALMRSLNMKLSNTIETIDGIKIGPSLINDMLKELKEFEIVLRQLFQLENKISIKEDIENSMSLILR